MVIVKSPHAGRGLGLSVQRTTLARGERTRVMLTVEGLQSITQSLPVEVQASETARPEGGNTQAIAIAPNPSEQRRRVLAYEINVELEIVLHLVKR